MDENLDDLSSGELHDRAVHLAVKRHDVGFLWNLLRDIPAAKASTSDAQGAETDIMRVSGLVNDFFNAGDGELADALRPVYLDYLTKHAS
ncbi:hypothetical protein GCM10027589_34280 [Actinocorallia lasiicapitis]